MSDLISKELFDQIKWERDIAIGQLKELGYGLGEKIRTDKDTISRQEAINIVDSETVSTNPEHFKSSEKFIKFMDNADIASFGQWQWANGFNTALVATKVQLEKLPSAQPEVIRCGECKHHEDEELGMVYCPIIVGNWVRDDWYCADAERKEQDDG